MSRIPILPTIVVVAAAATMVALGIWQLGRADEKEALLAQYETAQSSSEFSYLTPSTPEAAYTRTIIHCVETRDVRSMAGRNAKGANGWAHVARCTMGGEWPNTEAACIEWAQLLESGSQSDGASSSAKPMDEVCRDWDVDTSGLDNVLEPVDVVLGWSREPKAPTWDGGFVAGTVVPAGELGFKIVADPPQAGLEANAKPDPNDLPNNHLAYAGQWFFFALTALVIYALALKRRRQE